MDAQAVRQWGTTPPISTNLPTEKELMLNDQLVAELKRQNNFEAPSDTEKRFVLYPVIFSLTDILRTVVLRSLQKITVEFVKQVCTRKGLSQTVINEAGGKIFTFGSYRLGVFGPGRCLAGLVRRALF